MKLYLCTAKPIIVLILMSFIPSNNILAQESSAVVEPSIPIYIVCPYHEDSLKSAYSSSVPNNGSVFVYVINKCDTLQQHILKSSAENTARFTWLYALIALLGTMNIVLLFSTTRIRKELAQIKRLEHQHILSSSESATAFQTTPIAQEALFNPEPKDVQVSARIKKPRRRISK